MATLKQATSAILETVVVVPLATAEVAKAIAKTGVNTINKSSEATNKVLDGINMSLDIGLSELELVQHRTNAENQAIKKIEAEYFKSEDFQERMVKQAMQRYSVSEDEELTL